MGVSLSEERNLSSSETGRMVLEDDGHVLDVSTGSFPQVSVGEKARKNMKCIEKLYRETALDFAQAVSLCQDSLSQMIKQWPVIEAVYRVVVHYYLKLTTSLDQNYLTRTNNIKMSTHSPWSTALSSQPRSSKVSAGYRHPYWSSFWGNTEMCWLRSSKKT